MKIQQKCYKLFTSAKTWEQASTSCSTTSGASLASVENDEEQQFAFGLTNSEFTWLGGSDTETEGTFVWLSSGAVFMTDNVPVSGVYNKFKSGQPNVNSQDTQDCLSMKDTTGEWDAIASTLSKLI